MLLSCRIAEKEGWFSGQVGPLADPSRFSTFQLADIAQDEDNELKKTASVLGAVTQRDPHKISLEIRQAVSHSAQF